MAPNRNITRILIAAVLAAGTVFSSGASATMPRASETDRVATIRIPRPVFAAAGLVETDGGPLTLAGVAPTSLHETCGEAAAAWPCGRMARLALQRFVRLRTLDCTLADEAGSGTGRCLAGGDDLAEWLVAQGWAKADGPDYAEEEKAAREESLGIWSDVRPGLSGAPVLAASVSSDILPDDPAVRVLVSLASQTLTLVHDGATIAHWPVSTARSGKVTPLGAWTAKWLSRDHRSSLYDDAPMPWSIFFNGDYAIHGTYQTGRLGSPASAGCVRLDPENAAFLFRLVRREGLANTVIAINP